MEDIKKSVDRDKIGSARRALKRDFLIYIWSLVSLFIIVYPMMLIKNNLVSNLFEALMVILIISMFVSYISLIFRIRYVYRSMGKSSTTIILFQLGSIIIPFGIFIFPAIVLSESKNILTD